MNDHQKVYCATCANDTPALYHVLVFSPRKVSFLCSHHLQLLFSKFIDDATMGSIEATMLACWSNKKDKDTE